jgi:hypothetical protein
MERIIAVVVRLRAIERLCHEFPYVGSYEDSEPLADEADRLRLELDPELAQLLLSHPTTDVRRQLNKLDAEATELSAEIRSLLKGRPHAPYHITEEQFLSRA